MCREDSGGSGEKALGEVVREEQRGVTDLESPRLSNVSLMSVEQRVKGKSIRPAGGEIQDVDLTVRPGGLAHPAQQDLLAVCLLQV